MLMNHGQAVLNKHKNLKQRNTRFWGERSKIPCPSWEYLVEACNSRGSRQKSPLQGTAGPESGGEAPRERHGGHNDTNPTEALQFPDWWIACSRPPTPVTSTSHFMCKWQYTRGREGKFRLPRWKIGFWVIFQVEMLLTGLLHWVLLYGITVRAIS